MDVEEKLPSHAQTNVLGFKKKKILLLVTSFYSGFLLAWISFDLSPFIDYI
jgi:hypothetical protein